jgi:hypothetical protein
MPTTIKARLDQARDAYHKLQTGQAAAVYVDQNGERVEYQLTTARNLAAYISELEVQNAGQPAPRNSFYFSTSKGT